MWKWTAVCVCNFCGISPNKNGSYGCRFVWHEPLLNRLMQGMVAPESISNASATTNARDITDEIRYGTIPAVDRPDVQQLIHDIATTVSTQTSTY